MPKLLSYPFIWSQTILFYFFDVIVLLTPDKKPDLLRTKEKITEQARLFHICNPDNPAGYVLPVLKLKGLISEMFLLQVQSQYNKKGSENRDRFKQVTV